MRASAWGSHSRVTDIVHCSQVGPQKKKADAVAVFASDLKPSFMVLRALGLLPIEDLQTAYPSFRPTSGVFVYSLVCFLVVSGLATSVSGVVLIYLKKYRDSYDGSVYLAAFIVSLVPSLLLHPCYWFEVKKVVALLKKWLEFQELYLRTTGSQLKLRLRRLSVFCTMAVPLITFVIVLAELFIFEVALPNLVLAYTLTVSMMVNHGMVWVLQCNAICRSSQLIKNHLKLVLHQKSCSVSLRKLEALWLHLSRISTATANSLCTAHLMVTITCSIVVLLSSYGFLNTFDKTELHLISVGLGAYAVCIVIYLTMVYNAGYTVSAMMNDFCDEEIEDMIARDENIRHELHIFLHALKLNQPKISFAGVIDVNRKFLASFASAMLTYIVVLAQFRAGADTVDIEAPLAVITPTITTKAAPTA